MVEATGINTIAEHKKGMAAFGAWMKALENGLNGENAEQKAIEAGSGETGERSDVESDDLVALSKVNVGQATDLVDDSGCFEAVAAAVQEGGRGSDFTEGGGETQNGDSPRNFISNGGLAA